MAAPSSMSTRALASRVTCHQHHVCIALSLFEMPGKYPMTVLERFAYPRAYRYPLAPIAAE